jgi:hypothetical protein
MKSRYEACYLRKQWVATVPVLNRESEGAYSVRRLVFLATTEPEGRIVPGLGLDLPSPTRRLRAEGRCQSFVIPSLHSQWNERGQPCSFQFVVARVFEASGNIWVNLNLDI